VVAFTFRSETPTAVFDREKERQQTKLSPSLTVVAFTFRSETPTAVFDREKECQQTKQSHTTKTMATPSRSHPRFGHYHSIFKKMSQ
jgi:hypothetical protein